MTLAAAHILMCSSNRSPNYAKTSNFSRVLIYKSLFYNVADIRVYRTKT